MYRYKGRGWLGYQGPRYRFVEAVQEKMCSSVLSPRVLHVLPDTTSLIQFLTGNFRSIQASCARLQTLIGIRLDCFSDRYEIYKCFILLKGNDRVNSTLLCSVCE